MAKTLKQNGLVGTFRMSLVSRDVQHERNPDYDTNVSGESSLILLSVSPSKFSSPSVPDCMCNYGWNRRL